MVPKSTNGVGGHVSGDQCRVCTDIAVMVREPVGRLPDVRGEVTARSTAT